MRNLSVRKHIPTHYALPCRKGGRGENKMVKRAVQGMVVIGASYIGLQIVLGIFGFVLSAVGSLLPIGILSAAAYGAWQWLKSR
ncbi:MAG: hypothetical protein HYV51_02410 [Parcubacteria group bacterium]|nr:hypothetical protein [Parcubacteria group bacterium]